MKAVNMIFAFALFFTPVGDVAAKQFVIAHASPSAGSVVFVSDGLPVAGPLDYRGTASADIAAGAQVEVRSADDDAVLATLVVQPPESRADFREALVFTGNGTTHPLRIVHDRPRSFVEADPDSYLRISFLNVAPFPGTDDPGSRPVGIVQCTSQNAGGQASHRSVLNLAYSMTSDLRHQPRGIATCDFHVTLSTATLELPTAQLSPGRTYRLLVLGDGERAPIEALLLDHAVIVATSGVAELQPGAVIDSANFWFDAARPAQGVTLFEQPAARTVFGSWYTYDTSGAPTWFLLEGVHAEAPGRRDVTVRSVTRKSATEMTTVGTARLIYADCNEAELRAVIDGELRILSLRRKQVVDRCSVLE